MKKSMYMTRQRRRILAVMVATNEALTTVEIAERGQLPASTVRASMAGLERHGWVRCTTGQPCRGKPRRYVISTAECRVYILTAVLGGQRRRST